MIGRGCYSYLVYKVSDEREEIIGYWWYFVGCLK